VTRSADFSHSAGAVPRDYDSAVTLSQTTLDSLWDFADPEGSEARLRQAAAAAPAPVRDELLTQVARSLGLQGRFTEADALLDGAASPDPAVRVRVALERGRVRNSAGEPDAALPLLREAARAAEAADLLFLRVDALHMLAIVDQVHAREWVAEALRVLAATDDTRTLRWLVSLHNNAGWAELDAGRPADAVASFTRALSAAERYGTAQQIRWAEEALAEARAALPS